MTSTPADSAPTAFLNPQEQQIVLTLGPCSPFTNFTPAWALCLMFIVASVVAGGFTVLSLQPPRTQFRIPLGAGLLCALFLATAVYAFVAVLEEASRSLTVTITPDQLHVRRRGWWRTREFRWRRDEVFEVRVGAAARVPVPAIQVRLYDAPPESFLAGRDKRDLQRFAARVADAMRRLPAAQPVDARPAASANAPAAAPTLDYAHGGQRYEIDIRPFEGGVTIIIPPIGPSALLNAAPWVIAVGFVLFLGRFVAAFFNRDHEVALNIMRFAAFVGALLLARMAITLWRSKQPLTLTLDRKRLVIDNPAWLTRRRAWPAEFVQHIKLESSRRGAGDLLARLCVGNTWITLGRGRDEVELSRIESAINHVLLPQNIREKALRTKYITRQDLRPQTGTGPNSPLDRR